MGFAVVPELALGARALAAHLQSERVCEDGGRESVCECERESERECERVCERECEREWERERARECVWER